METSHEYLFIFSSKKTIENKHFIPNDSTEFFRNWRYKCLFGMPTCKNNYYYGFLILVQSFSACAFSRTVAANAGLFLIKPFIGLVIHFPCIKIAQTGNQNKTAAFAVIKWHLQQQEGKSVRRRARRQLTRLFGALSQGASCWLAGLYCLLHFLAFDWLRPAVLFFSNWTVCFFVKESPIWNYPNCSLIRQILTVKG